VVEEEEGEEGYHLSHLLLLRYQALAEQEVEVEEEEPSVPPHLSQ